MNSLRPIFLLFSYIECSSNLEFLKCLAIDVSIYFWAMGFEFLHCCRKRTKPVRLLLLSIMKFLIRNQWKGNTNNLGEFGSISHRPKINSGQLENLMNTSISERVKKIHQFDPPIRGEK